MSTITATNPDVMTKLEEMVAMLKRENKSEAFTQGQARVQRRPRHAGPKMGSETMTLPVRFTKDEYSALTEAANSNMRSLVQHVRFLVLVALEAGESAALVKQHEV